MAIEAWVIRAATMREQLRDQQLLSATSHSKSTNVAMMSLLLSFEDHEVGVP
jgi:hypothetical protein